MKDEPQKQADEELSEAEISARFESTVRRMANTKPVAKRPKAEGASSDAEKEIHVTRTSAKE